MKMFPQISNYLSSFLQDLLENEMKDMGRQKKAAKSKKKKLRGSVMLVWNLLKLSTVFGAVWGHRGGY